MDISTADRIRGGVIGLAAGEAEGIAESYGDSHTKGNWSRSTGLCLCTADSLLHQKDYNETMRNFADFSKGIKFTPPVKNFDVGMDVKRAIREFEDGKRLYAWSRCIEYSGYGSVVRMIPTAVYLGAINSLEYEPTYREMCAIHNIVRLIHTRAADIVPCALYVMIARLILGGFSSEESIYEGIRMTGRYYSDSLCYRQAIRHIRDLFNMDIFRLIPAEAVYSRENSVETVEASIWCLINTGSFEECINEAKRIGEDKDVLCAAVGGLAGLYYGCGNVPKVWIETLKNKEEIIYISKKLVQKFK